MQGRGEDRYIVREITGWNISLPECTTRRDTPPHTDVNVMDRLYGYKVVANYPATKSRGNRDYTERRLQAEATANLWNQEHRAWLHAGRWASGRVS